MIVVVPAAGRRSAGRLPSSAAAVALALLLSLHLVVVAVAVGAARGVVQRLPSYHGGGGGGGSAGGGPCALAVAPLGYPCEEHQVRVLFCPLSSVAPIST
jgi:lysosomal acid lipase/cholesteryl ester hydrolase